MTDPLTPSIVDLAGYGLHNSLFATLRQLEPADAYRILSSMRQDEIENSGSTDIDGVRATTTQRMQQAPLLAKSSDIGELADQFATFDAYKFCHDVFWTLYIDERERVASMIEIDGDPPSAGEPEVLLGMHIGPLYSAAPLLSALFTRITLIARIDLSGGIRAILGSRAAGLDFDTIVVPDKGSVFKSARALRAGRTLVVFPDSPPPPGARTRRVSLLGRDLVVAEGVEAIARMGDVPIRPFSFEQIGLARYRFTFWPPLERDGSLEQYFLKLETMLLGRAAATWHGWRYLDQMLPQQR